MDASSSCALEDIYANCVEVGDCLIWQGGYTSNGYPQISRPHLGTSSGRRVVYLLAHGAIQPGRSIALSCPHKGCLRLEHLLPRTAHQIGMAASKSGSFSRAGRVAAITRTKRATQAKLTMDQAREIRASDLSGPALAEAYGVHRSLIVRIRRGQAWRESARGSSIFSL